MFFTINSDGSIKIINPTEDKAGKVIMTKTHESLTTYRTKKGKASAKSGKKLRRLSYEEKYAEKCKAERLSQINVQKQRKKKKSSSPSKDVVTVGIIDNYINRKKEPISQKNQEALLKIIPDELKEYFIEKCLEKNNKLKEANSKEVKAKSQQKNKRKTNKQKPKELKKTTIPISPNSLASRAVFTGKNILQHPEAFHALGRKIG